MGRRRRSRDPLPKAPTPRARPSGLPPKAEKRLSELARAHGLDDRACRRLAAILVELAVDARAPTTVRAPGDAVDVHIADSLAALDLACVRAAARIVDIGSGAGFPALPLAAVLPDTTVTALESQARKCLHIRRLAHAARLPNLITICARAEAWEDGRRAADVALARAVGSQPLVLEYAAPLLAEGGWLVDWRTAAADDDGAAAAAARMLGMEAVAIESTTPYASSRARRLHLFRKVRATPERFPRRAGVAARRPLGS